MVRLLACRCISTCDAINRQLLSTNHISQDGTEGIERKRPRRDFPHFPAYGMWPTSGGHSELPLPMYTGHLPSLRHTPTFSLDKNYGDDFSDVGSVYSSHLVDPGLTKCV